MGRMSAMILAGGKGTRMDMLCHVRAKPALPFAGSHRVIDFTLSNCLNSGISDVAVMVDHQRKCLREYVGKSSFMNCWSGLKIIEPGQGSYQGTADAVFQNLGLIQDVRPEAVLILAGDHVYRMDYRKMLEYHERMGADVTVGVVAVPITEGHRFGIVKTDGNGRIIEFEEKPRFPNSTLASMGIYIFNRDILVQRLTEDACQPSSSHDFGKSIIPSMINRLKVFAYQFFGYWQDIGTIESYFTANMELINPDPALCLNGEWPIMSGDGFTLIDGETQPGIVRNSRIGTGCIIEGIVENSVVSHGVTVEKHAVVKNSVVMSGTVVGWHSVVDRCIVDENVRIGKSCYLGFGGHSHTGPNITVLGKGATVPDYTAIDLNCRIGPYSTVEDFKTNTVVSGSVVQPRYA